jgi:hypothetical protein
MTGWSGPATRWTRLAAVSAALATAAALQPVGPSPGRADAAAAAHGVEAAAAPPLVWGIGGISTRADVESLESSVGRRFNAVRVFLVWNSTFPTSYHTWLASTGRRPLISVRAQRSDGSLVLWRSIADAAPGSALYTQLTSWADRIKAYGVPVYFTFNHEPEAKDSNGNGDQAAFIAAWRKVVTLFRARGVTNAKYLWIMTENAFRLPSSDRRYAPKWYPGDAWVDALGADVYNDYTCRTTSDSPWYRLTTEIETFRAFGAAHPTKELWLAEWASSEDPADPTRKGRWIAEVRADLKDPKYAQIRGLLYFHRFRVGTPCTWYVNSTPAALDAFRAMGADPFYAGTS